MEFETQYVHLCIRNNILVGTYKRNLRINLEAAKAIVFARKTFTGQKRFPALINCQGVVSMDKPARQYLSSPEAIDGLSASAIVVNTAFSSFLSNFFLAVNKTSIPVKIFSSVARAEAWLQQFVE